MDKSTMNTWMQRIMGGVLLIAYAPSYAVLVQYANRIWEALGEHGWWLCLPLYALGSCAVVAMALLSLIAGAKFLRPRTTIALTLFLVVNWLPHTFFVLSFIPLPPGSWID